MLPIVRNLRGQKDITEFCVILRLVGLWRSKVIATLGYGRWYGLLIMLALGSPCGPPSQLDWPSEHRCGAQRGQPLPSFNNLL